MAKKKKKKLRPIWIIILVLFAISSIGMGIYLQNVPKKVSEKIIYSDIPKPVVEESNISLVMIGDALIHGAVYNDAKKGSTYDFKPMFSEIRDVFKDSELRFYNQETILGGTSLGLSNYPQFNSPQEVGDAFMDMGFNLVSLATNHTLDKGYSTKYKTITNSREYWDKQTDVIAAGSYTSFDKRDEVIIKEVNGIKYGFLAYTTYTNGLVVPKGKEYYVNVYDEDIVKKDVEKIRDKVDLLMVSMHWGTEYNLGVSSSQKKIANYLSSLGVDIIIGTHPHVVEPIEFIGKTMVVYSLGNFISAQVGVEKLTGLIAKVGIKKTTVDGKVYMELYNPQADLIYTCKAAQCGHFKVYPYNKLTSKILPDSKKHYDKYMGVVRKLDKNIGTIYTKEA